MVEVKAYHFKYIGGSSQETRKFYARFIRGFLRWHRTKAVWVKGGQTRREAFIVVTEDLIGPLTKMLKDTLREGGSFSYSEANAAYVIYEAAELERETVGFLRVGNTTLGDPDRINCPKESYEEVSVQEYCRGEKFDARCDAWDYYHCIYPERTGSAISHV